MTTLVAPLTSTTAAGITYINLISQNFASKRNTKITNKPISFGSEWKIKVEFFLRNEEFSGWHEIFRFGTGTGDTVYCGNRYPGVFVYPGELGKASVEKKTMKRILFHKCFTPLFLHVRFRI